MSVRANGGAVVAKRLVEHGVRHLFTLCGGHISPILVEAKAHGIRVVDVRDEASSVFAADAVARMTGIPGVAAVTAGPGVTNAITAVKNAQMAQSPVLVIGGATATILKGRGSLQDIDQLSLMRPITKHARAVRTLKAVGPAIDRALSIATSGVPGPVFLELPVDLLYDEAVVRDWYLQETGVAQPRNLAGHALKLYLQTYLLRQFHAPAVGPVARRLVGSVAGLRRESDGQVERVAAITERLRSSRRPVLVIGSQTLAMVKDPQPIAQAVEALGVPTYLAGMARGLLGVDSRIQFRHKRSRALRDADLVLVCGFPFDFRLGYGRSINRRAEVVAVNLSASELCQNRRPEVAVRMHAGQFLERLAGAADSPVEAWEEWFETLRRREAERDAEIRSLAEEAPEEGRLNPLAFFLGLDRVLGDDAILVVDGGDFVATASYVLRPRGPLRWLDPGAFGTLGVGGGFALGAALVRPKAETWLIYGDGSSAYSLAEFDTYLRHGLAPIAVVGNDGSWAQIAREQTEILGDDVGTVLRTTAYEEVAAGYGGRGLLLDDPAKLTSTLQEARELAAAGTPVCINVPIDRSGFRKGSISM